MRRCVPCGHRRSMILLAILILTCASSFGDEGSEGAAALPSKAAAERCSLKLKSLEDFAANHKAGQKQTTQFFEDEVNSYLALCLSQKYHPSLKSLEVTFEKEKLQGVALLDFDRIGSPPEGLFSRIIGVLFAGKHNLTARGEIISGKGKASFHLEQAWLDGRELPRFLVEEIITTVGRKQKPPFDPMQPSQIPYKIQSLELLQGSIMVYQ